MPNSKRRSVVIDEAGYVEFNVIYWDKYPQFFMRAEGDQCGDVGCCTIEISDVVPFGLRVA